MADHCPGARGDSGEFHPQDVLGGSAGDLDVHADLGVAARGGRLQQDQRVGWVGIEQGGAAATAANASSASSAQPAAMAK